MKPINHSNYESFYLDYLEGNLPEEQTQLLLQFLALHPELCVDDEFTSVQLESSEVQLSDFEKMLLKKEPSISDLNETTLSYFLIAQQEGELSQEQELQLENWMEENSSYKSEQALVAQLKLQPNTHLIYTDKASLKQKKTKIIPMQLYWSSAAVAAGFALFWSLNMEQSTTIGSAKNGVKQPIADSTQLSPSIQNNAQNKENIASATSYNKDLVKQTVEQKTIPFQNKIIKEKSVVEKNDRIEQLNRRPIYSNQDANMMILPRQFALSNQVTLPETNSEGNKNDLAWVSVSEMNNPVAPITNTLSEKLNREIDFRRVKPTDKKAGGFFIKIGKFEIMHKGGK